jgi:hypothetical protein
VGIDDQIVHNRRAEVCKGELQALALLLVVGGWGMVRFASFGREAEGQLGQSRLVVLQVGNILKESQIDGHVSAGRTFAYSQVG